MTACGTKSHPSKHHSTLVALLGVLILIKLFKRSPAPAPAPCPAPEPVEQICFPAPPALRSIPEGPETTVTIDGSTITTFADAITALGATGGTILINGQFYNPSAPLLVTDTPITLPFLRVTSLNPAYLACINLTSAFGMRFTGTGVTGQSQTVVIDFVQMFQGVDGATRCVFLAGTDIDFYA
jgi:hypothetical protein